MESYAANVAFQRSAAVEGFGPVAADHIRLSGASGSGTFSNDAMEQYATSLTA